MYILLDFMNSEVHVIAPRYPIKCRLRCLNRLLEQGYIATRLSSLQTFYGRCHELVDRYGVSICAMKTERVIVFLFSFVYPGLDFL